MDFQIPELTEVSMELGVGVSRCCEYKGYANVCSKWVDVKQRERSL